MPRTLLEASIFFNNPDNCLNFLVSVRWPSGIICHHCGFKGDHYFIKTKRAWKCRECRKRFSVKMGTIFEDSNIGLHKWLVAMWLLCNAKNGISSYEIHRSWGVTQKTAWFMLQRLRLAFHEGTFEKKLGGIVEVDETYIGGKARNMHKDKKKVKIKGRGGTGKVIVMGLLERKGKIRAKVVGDAKRNTLQGQIELNVAEGSEICSDELSSYKGLDPTYVHNVVNHAETYVIGHVHTNGLENFWSLLKRTISGTYVSVEPFHLVRYLDEQTFRFNYRKGSDQDRFITALASIPGKRLTYNQLIGLGG